MNQPTGSSPQGNGASNAPARYAAFRVPAFRRYLSGALLMQIGSAAQSVAVGWELYDRTGQALSLGLQGLVQAVPMLLFTLPAGYLADAFDRRKLIVAGLLGITVTSLCLFALSETRGSVALIYAVLFLDSTAQRIAWPARTALLPLLVPTELFESAIKWRTALTHASAMLGPALGGFLVAWRPSVAYAFSAAGSSMFALMLLTMRIPHATRIQSGRVLAQIGEGLRFVAENKLLLSSISLDLFAVLLGGADYLLPIYARDILNLKAVGLDPQQALGWLRAAPAAGAACVSLALAHLPPMRRAGASMLWAVAGFGVATLVFGLSRNFWLSLVMLAVSGGLDNVSIVVRQTLVQLAAPNEMRGRVSAVNALFIGSSNQLGGFESGLVAHFFGPVASVVSGGIGTLCIVAAWTGFFPSLRRFGTFSEAARQTP